MSHGNLYSHGSNHRVTVMRGGVVRLVFVGSVWIAQYPTTRVAHSYGHEVGKSHLAQFALADPVVVERSRGRAVLDGYVLEAAGRVAERWVVESIDFLSRQNPAEII